MGLVSRKQKSKDPAARDKGSELWLISYADMMTLLVGFFIILLSVSTLDDRKLKNLSKEISDSTGKGRSVATTDSRSVLKVDEMDERRLEAMSILASRLNLGSVDDIVTRIEKGEEAKELVETARKTLEDESRGGDIAFQKAGETFELVLPSQTLFASGSATLTPQAEGSLKRVVTRIRSLENLLQVRIEGHTDSTPIGKTSTSAYTDNWGLSSARAGAVAAYFAKCGLDPKLLLTSGFADTRPLFAEVDAKGTPIMENKMKNRRVHLVLAVKKRGD